MLLGSDAAGQWIPDIWPASNCSPRKLVSGMRAVDLWAWQCWSAIVERVEQHPLLSTNDLPAFKRYPWSASTNRPLFYRYEHQNLVAMFKWCLGHLTNWLDSGWLAGGRFTTALESYGLEGLTLNLFNWAVNERNKTPYVLGNVAWRRAHNPGEKYGWDDLRALIEKMRIWYAGPNTLKGKGFWTGLTWANHPYFTADWLTPYEFPWVWAEGDIIGLYVCIGASAFGYKEYSSGGCWWEPGEPWTYEDNVTSHDGFRKISVCTQLWWNVDVLASVVTPKVAQVYAKSMWSKYAWKYEDIYDGITEHDIPCPEPICGHWTEASQIVTKTSVWDGVGSGLEAYISATNWVFVESFQNWTGSSIKWGPTKDSLEQTLDWYEGGRSPRYSFWYGGCSDENECEPCDSGWRQHVRFHWPNIHMYWEPYVIGEAELLYIVNTNSLLQ